MMLALDDPRWSALQTHSADAAWVPRWLRRVLEAPDKVEILDEGRWMLWSDENAWSASFAAAPYLVEAAGRASPQARLEYVSLMGLIAAYRTRPGTGTPHDACPANLEESFQQATAQALSLAAGLLPLSWDEKRTVLLIAAVAALKDLLRLSRVIEAGVVVCKSCGAVVDLVMPKYGYDEELNFKPSIVADRD